MNPKSFPKRLDSKTSCLRITVPENLDLALEGLIRKVLKEQPKTDDVYAFAADYFETLLKIRDKAGAKFTAAQLCPFHNEEDAHEMIILAGSLSKRAADGKRNKEDCSCFPNTKILGRKKKTDKAELESLEKSKGRVKKQDRKKKQATPDLIKKLPISEGRKSEREDADKAPKREAMDGGSVKDDFLPSDPIKELVEKELSATSGGDSADKKDRVPSDGDATGPTAIDGEPKSTEEIVGSRATPPPTHKASETNDSEVQTAREEQTGTTKNEENKIDAQTSNASVKLTESEKVVKDSEVLTGAEPEGSQILKETKPKEVKENEEEPDRLQTDEKPQEKAESKVTKETAPEAITAPLPDELAGAEERMSQETVAPEMRGGDKAETDLGMNLEDRREEQRETSPETSPPRVGELEVVNLRRAPSEDKTETEDVPRPSPAAKEEKAHLALEGEMEKASDSQDAGPADKDDVLTAEPGEKEQGQKTGEKKANDHATESTAQDEATNEDQAKDQENYSQSAVLPDGSEANREFVDNKSGARTLDEETRKRREEESEKEEKIRDAKQEDPIKLPPTEEEKVTSAVEKEEENATEVVGKLGNAAAMDSAGESREVEAVQPSEEHGGVEDRSRAILVTEQLPVSAEPAESGKGDEGVSVKDQNPEKDGKEHPTASPDEGIKTGEGAPTYDSSLQSTSEEYKTDVRETGGGSNASLVMESSSKITTGTVGLEEGPKDNPAAGDEDNQAVEEELCSVVDVDVLRVPKEDAPIGRTPEDPGQAEPPPSGKSAFEREDAPDNSPTQLTSSEKSEQPNATVALNVPVITENVMAGSEAHPTPDTRELHTPLSTFGEDVSDSSAGGKHIVVIEDAEREEGSPEPSVPVGEIKIKTIQTHYYDALRVPEIVTREYRVRDVAGTAGLVGADDQPPTSKTSSSNEEVPPSAEVPEVAERGVTLYSADDHRDPPADPSPDSDQVSKTSEPSLQTTCEMFLSNERLFSSAEKEGIMYVSHERVVDKVQAADLSESGRDGGMGMATDPGQPSENENAPGATQENSEILSDLTYGRTSGDLSIVSGTAENDAEPSPTNARDEEEPKGTKTEGESFKEKAEDLLPGLEEPLQDTLTREGMSAVVGSSGETDSTASSAATEVKRLDSAGRSFSSVPRPSSSRSLDLGGRNPLLRTRSLSTHRHGVADFEVWTTIEKELEEAATKIQSKFRGYKTRKKLRRENAVQITTEESSRRTTPVEAEEGDDRRRGTGEFHDVVVLSDHPR